MSAPRTVLLALTLLPGCSGSDQPPPADTPASALAPADGAPASAPARTALVVSSGQGQAWGTLEPKGEGYGIRGGPVEGAKIKIDADRVKLKDASGATVAKVKAKDYGFKVYRGDEDEAAKVKRKGAGFKVSDPAGAAWGEVSGEGGTLGGQPVAIKTEGDKIVVERDGQVVGEVEARVGAKAAAMLAVTELPMEHRVAAMIFVQEKEP